MKKYIGTKQIEAEPMTRGDAWGKHLLREKPTIENFDDAGYHVKYKDGYESWSPAEAFEEAYKISDTALDRMKIEDYELFDKMGKLYKFILSDKFECLEPISRSMLKVQYKMMVNYSQVLNHRISSLQSNECNLKGLNFGQAIEYLKAGQVVRRAEWEKQGLLAHKNNNSPAVQACCDGKALFVIKQVPTHIKSDVIPKMQSLPQSAKDIILRGKGFIDYTSQCLIYNENTGRADSWIPSIADVFAEDWEVVL